MALPQRTRASGAVRLCDLDPEVRSLAIECRPCSRRGQYPLKSLIEAFGPQAGLPDVRYALVSGGACTGSISPPRPCHARFPRIAHRQVRREGTA